MRNGRRGICLLVFVLSLNCFVTGQIQGIKEDSLSSQRERLIREKVRLDTILPNEEDVLWLFLIIPRVSEYTEIIIL